LAAGGANSFIFQSSALAWDHVYLNWLQTSETWAFNFHFLFLVFFAQLILRCYATIIVAVKGLVGADESLLRPVDE
jgi:hypothetical protein